MKIEVKSYTSYASLISSIVFLALGALMFTNPDAVVIITSYVLGTIICIYGTYLCIKNYVEVKKDNSTSSREMVLGITLIVIGLVFIFLAKVIETIIRFVLGGWILFSGINRLINSLYIVNKKTKSFWANLIISLLLMGGGLYTILEANLAFQTIGLILILYAILEIIGFIFNRSENTKIKVNIQEEETKPKTKKKIKEAKVINEDKKKTKKSSN